MDLQNFPYKNLRKFAFFLLLLLCYQDVALASEPKYKLFKNEEGFGIVVFPVENLFAELNNYIQSINFKEVETGEAVMRFGTTDRDNQTYMMPEPVQKKHGIEKFIILQVISDNGILVGIYDLQWGLTLPFATYDLDSVKEKIPKTLDVFRNKLSDEEKRGKTILWRYN